MPKRAATAGRRLVKVKGKQEMRRTKRREKPSDEKYKHVVAMVPLWLWLGCWHFVRESEWCGSCAQPSGLRRDRDGRSEPGRVCARARGWQAGTAIQVTAWTRLPHTTTRYQTHLSSPFQMSFTTLLLPTLLSHINPLPPLEPHPPHPLLSSSLPTRHRTITPTSIFFLQLGILSQISTLIFWSVN